MKKYLPLVLLAAVTLGIYAPVLWNGFVWDDYALVLRDPLIRSWRLIPEGFNHFLFVDATASDFYRPIQRLSYALEYGAVGFQPALYHFDNVLFHLLAAVALWFFARELLRSLGSEGRLSDWAATLAAIIWAVHPLHSSAVAYISGRADSLTAMFGFAGMICALRASNALGFRQLGLLAGAALLLLASALSKEAGLIFLAVWITVTIAQRNWRATSWAAITALFVSISYASLRLAAEHIPAPAPAAMPLLVRPILFARAVAEYAGLLICPRHLQMERDVATHPFGFSNASLDVAAWRELQTLAGIILIAGFVYWLWRSRALARPIFVCLILTAITYLPVSTAFQLNATVAEHWLYLPSAFLFLAITWQLFVILERTKKSLVRPIAFALLTIWMIFLGSRTFIRTFDWKDQRTFLERTIAQGGDSARMLINLGGLELKEGRLEEAKKALTAALAKEPDQPFAVINLAAVAIKQSDFARAHELLDRAATMPLVAAQAYEQMAVLESKETGQANLRRLHLATRTGPPNWAIEKRYVQLLDEVGKTNVAIKELQICLQSQWYRAGSWELLAELLRKIGQPEKAQQAVGNALRYDVHLHDKKSELAGR